MMLGDLFDAYGRWLVRRRGWALLLVVLVTIASIVGIQNRLKQGSPLDFTPQAMFMGEGGMWERLQDIENEFGAEDNDLLFLLEGPIASPDGIQSIRDLTDILADHTRVERVDSIANASIVTGDDSGMLTTVDAIGEGKDPLALAAQDPFVGTLLISESQRVATIRVRLDSDLHQINDLAPVVKQLVAQARSVSLGDGFTLHPTGVPFVRTEVVDMMIADEVRFIPIVAGLGALTICLLFRRVWFGLIPLVGVGVATLWAMSALLTSGATLNILSILTPILILVIGSADGIHLVSRYREELYSTEGDDPGPGATLDKAGAMGRTLRQMTLACFLTTFTTAAGFASLIVADTQVIRDFGLQVGAGVMVTFIAVLLAIPTFLAWLPAHRVGRPSEPRIHRVYDMVDSMVSRFPMRVVGLTIAIVFLSLWLGRNVQTNSRLLEMYQPQHPTWKAIHLAQDEVGGVVPIFVHFEGEPGQMIEPEILEKVSTLENELRKEELTGWTTSHASWIAHLHKLLTGEEALPQTREAAAQELLLAEMSGDLPLDQVLSADQARARILITAMDAGGREYLRVKNETEQRAADLFAGTGIRVDVTGDGMLASDGVEQLITDLLSSLGIMFAVIMATMLVLLRDIRQALIAFVPNVVPLFFILAALGIQGLELQTSNIVTFTIAVGLAVDDTIHFIVRYREERRAGRDRASAIKRTYHGAGHAIILTSILLVVGFGAMGFSELTSTQHFGMLASITMVAAVFGDLFLLPALLHLFGRSRSASSADAGDYST